MVTKRKKVVLRLTSDLLIITGKPKKNQKKTKKKKFKRH